MWFVYDVNRLMIRSSEWQAFVNTVVVRIIIYCLDCSKESAKSEVLYNIS